MRAKLVLFRLICCGFAATAVAEKVGTTNDGGLKVGPKPKPKSTPAEQVLEPIRNDNSGAFGNKPKAPAATPVKGPVVQKPPPVVVPVPRPAMVSSGASTLKATYTFDFEGGKAGGEGDLFYNHRDEVIRFLRPQNGATVALLQRSRFERVDADQLKAASYSDKPINVSDNADNQLRRGVVIAIKTRNGHFAKVGVTTYGADLALEWVTYR
jgi:hypothetical protein